MPADGNSTTAAATGKKHDPGTTQVTPKELWRILDRAREKGIEVRLVTFDPHGLGGPQLLSAGVTIDRSGRWLDPKIEPPGAP